VWWRREDDLVVQKLKTHSGRQPAIEKKKMGGSLQKDFSMKIHFLFSVS
jgi:hypothetical protein